MKIMEIIGVIFWLLMCVVFPPIIPFVIIILLMAIALKK